VSKGIGRTQQAILTALADEELPTSMTVAELAQRIDRSDGQIRRAVRSLESRGLVILQRIMLGHKGIGEYGPLRVKDEVKFQRGSKRGQDIPTAVSVKAGDPWPLRPGLIATVDTEFYREGMPTPGLIIALPHRRLLALKAWCEHRERELNDEERAKYRQLYGGCQLSDDDRDVLDRLTGQQTV
jgi:hypothetical protein